MRSFAILTAFCAIAPALAFPGMGNLGDAAHLEARNKAPEYPGPKGTKTCFPAPRIPERAPLITQQFPYTGALIDGKNGTEVGGVPVPMPGDSAHEFQHPVPGAYRGPW